MSLLSTDVSTVQYLRTMYSMSLLSTDVSTAQYLQELRPYPVPRSLGTIPTDRGNRDGLPRDKRDNLSNFNNI